MRRIVIMLVEAQLFALLLYIALRDALEFADEQRPRGADVPPRDPRVSVAWEGCA